MRALLAGALGAAFGYRFGAGFSMTLANEALFPIAGGLVLGGPAGAALAGIGYFVAGEIAMKPAQDRYAEYGNRPLKLAPAQPQTPAQPQQQPAYQQPAPPPAPALGSPWQAYKYQDGTFNQIWVRHSTNGGWRYVNSPAFYGQYGIHANESNVHWGIPDGLGWPGADQAMWYRAG